MTQRNADPAIEPVDLHRMGDVAEIVRSGGGPRQSMRGFEATYRNIVDYIVRITYRIWEEADMGYIYDTYADDCVVHTGYGTSRTVGAVVSGSVAMLAAFPDRKMHPEDVIWTGDDRTGFITSHLIANAATNRGYTAWGPPTGRAVRFFAIADCFVRENRIVEEWLVRDTAAIVRQLGFDPLRIAKSMRRPDLDSRDLARPERAPADGIEPNPYAADASDAESLVRDMFDDVFNRRRFVEIARKHAVEAETWVPNHARLQGAEHVRTYLLGLSTMFPDARLHVDRVSSQVSADGSHRVAVRWRLLGTHGGPGWYGVPTQRTAEILGISHLHVRDGLVEKHVLVFDELAVLAQLHGHEDDVVSR